jgi:hypothetical protein
MTRILQPELLDELPATDPRAMHSRRDLRRINALMGNARSIVRYVTHFAGNGSRGLPLVIAEIGAGDGNISTQVANALARRNVSGALLLVDRQPLNAPWRCAWKAQLVQADIFAWLKDARRVDAIIANLFLHHFRDEELASMLRDCAERCDCFVAAEPRRSSIAEWFSRRVRLIGCNEVTRHDAVVSVRAGFTGSELTTLWPGGSEWSVTERRVGLFTHFFGAMRGR